MNELGLILKDKLIFPRKNYPEPKKYEDGKTVKDIVEIIKETLSSKPLTLI